MERFYCKYDAIKDENFYEKCEDQTVDEKYEEFERWAQEQGIIAPRIRFPAKFGKMGLIGVECKEEIGFNEGFCFVPTKITWLY